MIVLVSGWSKPDFLWGTFERFFARRGYETVRASYPRRGLAPIQYSAKEVLKTLEEAKLSSDHVTLVGHSMGGLIGRWLICRGGAEDLVDSYISLGTPHKGTYLARFAPFSESARQMASNSGFINRLCQEEWPDSIPALGIQAQYEELVFPRCNAKIDFGENHIIPGATHGSLITNKLSLEVMYRWLQKKTLAEYTSS